MKFLCIACDQAMRLTEAGGPDQGSLTVTFACPACGHRVAMLTNPWETQLVRTLGVKVGGASAEAAPFAAVRAGLARQRDGALAPDTRGSAAAAMPTAPADPAAPRPSDGPGCPFAAMVGAAGDPASVPWTPEAEDRLARIPAFIRPMAKQAIERFARERSHGTITGEVLDQAREFMGM
jgi:DNA-directed RNA polymerase subunit RPC12/RpoP